MHPFFFSSRLYFCFSLRMLASLKVQFLAFRFSLVPPLAFHKAVSSPKAVKFLPWFVLSAPLAADRRTRDYGRFLSTFPAS